MHLASLHSRWWWPLILNANISLEAKYENDIQRLHGVTVYSRRHCSLLLSPFYTFFYFSGLSEPRRLYFYLPAHSQYPTCGHPNQGKLKKEEFIGIGTYSFRRLVKVHDYHDKEVWWQEGMLLECMAESLHLDIEPQCREELTGGGMRFGNRKACLSDTYYPRTRPRPLILPKQFTNCGAGTHEPMRIF